MDLKGIYIRNLDSYYLFADLYVGRYTKRQNSKNSEINLSQKFS